MLISKSCLIALCILVKFGWSYSYKFQSCRKWTFQIMSNNEKFKGDGSFPLSFKDESMNSLVRPGLKSLSFLFSVGTVVAGSTVVFGSVPPKNLKPIVILGSAGKTGKLIVDSLVSKGYKVRPTYREVLKDSESGNELIEKPVKADVKDVDNLINAVEGASVVIFAASASKKGGDAKAVDYLGVKNIAQACIQQKIPKLVIISSGAVTRPDSIGFKITNLFGRIMEYKLQGEDAVRELYSDASASDLSYVIVRPGGLNDGNAEGAGKIMINQGDTLIGDINRADVAECVVTAAISSTIPKDVTLEIYRIEGSGTLEGKFGPKSGYERSGAELGSFDKMLEGLTPDSAIKLV